MDTARLSQRVVDLDILHTLGGQVIQRWLDDPGPDAPRLMGWLDHAINAGNENAASLGVWLSPPPGLLGWPSALAESSTRYWMVTIHPTSTGQPSARTLHVAHDLAALLNAVPGIAETIRLDHAALTREEQTLLILSAAS